VLAWLRALIVGPVLNLGARFLHEHGVISSGFNNLKKSSGRFCQPRDAAEAGAESELRDDADGVAPSMGRS
jgi:hypothetical protein